MPELPEVETIVRGLGPIIGGKTIADVEVILAKTIWVDEIRASGPQDVSKFISLIKGNKIVSITRRGKMIIIKLASDTTLLIHLKMTGQLIYIDSQRRLAGGHPTTDMLEELPNKSTRVIFHLQQGGILYFNDQRQFGYIKAILSANLDKHKAYISYGPEPLESSFNEQYLYSIIKKRKNIKIKQLIMDQSVIAGIGNIYADESLFLAGIHPAKPAGTLTQDQISRLVVAIKKVLTMGLEYGGTSSEHYVQATGQKGSMQNHLAVYRKEGQPCPNCGSMINRMVVGGRGTHYCSICQV